MSDDVEQAIIEWEAQGRTDEQKWAVRNFFTGRGIKLLKDIRQDGMQTAKARVLARTAIPPDAKNPTRDAIVILGEEIAAIIQDDIDRLTPRKETE